MTAADPSAIARLIVAATTTLSLAACSSTLSLGGRDSTTSPAKRDAGKPAANASATRDDTTAIEAERVFAGLSEEASQEAARTFKVELRRGELAELVPADELLGEVAATCGPKIWEQCLVARQPPNKLAWSQWTFKRKDNTRVFRYPDMFYDKVEAVWAAKVARYILANGGDAGPTLVQMTEEKCGKPVDTRCQVRQRYGAGFVLTVEATGETIDVMSTLDVWKRDL